MPEAIAQIRRDASGLNEEIGELNRRASELRGTLEQQDWQMGATAQQLEKYRDALSRGANLSQDDVGQMKAIQEVIQAQGGDAGRAYLATLSRIDMARTPPGQISRPMSPDEREASRDRGMTEDEVSRARMMGDHTAIVHPRRAQPGPASTREDPAPDPDDSAVPEDADEVRRPRPQPGPASTGGQFVEGGLNYGPNPNPGPSAELEQLREDASKISQAMDPEIDAHRRRQAQVRASAMAEQDLQREWRETGEMLKQQTRDLERAEGQFDQLAHYRKEGINLSDREELKLKDLPGRIADLRQGQTQLELERSAVGAAGAAKGMFVNESGQMAAAGGGRGGGIRSLMGTLGGSGGGGGLGMGMGLRMLGTGSVATVGLLAAVEAWRFMNRAAETYEGTQRRIFDTGMKLGGGFDQLREEAGAGLRGPFQVSFQEQMQARLAMGMQTGQTDAGGVIEFARAYGLDIGSTAGLIGRMGTLGAMPMSHLVGGGAPSAGPIARGRGASGSWGGGASGSWEKSFLEGASDYGAQVAHTRGDPTLDARAVPNAMPLPAPRPGPIARRSGRGIEHILAAAYKESGLPGDGDAGNAMMMSFLEQAGRLYEQQAAAGGAPIADFEAGPAMMARAAASFGDAGLTPGASLRFGAQLTGGLVQGLQNPQDPVRRGLQLRAIMQLGREMSPEQLAKFREATENKAPGGGIDLTTYSGATAAMQNMTSLPDDQREPVMKAVMQAFTKVTGGGDLRAMALSNAFFGGQAAPGITLSRKWDELNVGGLSKDENASFVELYQKLKGEAGSEAAPFTQDRQLELVETRVGVLKRVSQSVKGTVLDFATDIEEASAIWHDRVSPLAGE